jgi:hypothetical protein
MTIWKKALIDAVEHVKNAPIQGKICRPFEEKRGITINESMQKTTIIMITAL